MGAVFLAEDLTLERPVAVKVLPPEMSHDPKVVARFEREAMTSAKLDHPNIVPIFAVEAREGLHYFVMKFVAGESLERIARQGPMAVEQVQGILQQAALALGHAHERGIAHRDVKPANVMIDLDGHVWLADFGISKAMQSATRFTGTGQVIGTPHYMSPEQAKGVEVDGRTDQYSLGVVGYQLLAGTLPFADESVHTVIFKHVSEEPVALSRLRPELPPFLVTAIHRALAKNPDDRFPHMEDFADAVMPGRRVSFPVSVVVSESVRHQRVSTGPTEVSERAATEAAVTEAATAVVVRPSGWRRMLGRAATLVAVMVVGLGAAAWSRGALIPGPARNGSDVGVPVGPREEAVAVATKEAANDRGIGLDSIRANGGTFAPTRDSVPPGVARSGGGSGGSNPDQATRRPSASGGADHPAGNGRRPPEPSEVAIPVQRGAPSVRRDSERRPGFVDRLRSGQLAIASEPSARLYLDGVFLRETPIFNHRVPSGSHVVRLERAGCATVQDTVTVRSARPFRKFYELSCPD